MSLEDNCRELLRKEFESSQLMQDIVSENDLEEIDRTFMEVGAEVVSNANDPKRKKRLLIIMFRIGESIESDTIVSFAGDHLEEWKEKYGERV